MFARAFPKEMPRIPRVHANRAAPVGGRGVEPALMGRLKGALPVRHAVSVFAGRSGHESDAKNAAVARVTKARDRDRVCP
jgi:hypothetical protein